MNTLNKITELQEINKNLNKLKNKIKQDEKDIESMFHSQFNFSDKNTEISYINDKFLSITVQKYSELTNFLNNCKPYKNAHRIKYGSFEHDIVNPFKISLNSEIRNGVFLKLECYLINDFMIWIKIPLNNLPSYLVDKYTSSYNRSVTDSESHYFTGHSYSEINQIKIPARNFRGYQLNWYGGDKTLLTHDKNTVYSSVCDDFINEIKNNPNKDQY